MGMSIRDISVPFDLPVSIPYHARPQRADYVRKWHREARHNRRAEYLADKCCLHCGAGSFLEIHHRDPNQKVDHRHIWHWKQERRLEELAKCDVLCDSCHNQQRAMTVLLKLGWTGWRGDGWI